MTWDVVETLELLALNTVAIYDCEPGSLETLALLQETIKAHAENAEERVQYTSRNMLEWGMYGFIYSTATRIDAAITGHFSLPSDATIEAMAPEVDPLRELDWHAAWRDGETRARQESPDPWGEILRNAISN